MTTIEKTVEIDLYDIKSELDWDDVEGILDDWDIEEIEEYLNERKKKIDFNSKTPYVLKGAKKTLIDLCACRCRRNLQEDKEEVKNAVLEIIDEVFD